MTFLLPSFLPSPPDILGLGDGRGDRAGAVAQPRARHGRSLRHHLRPARRLQGKIFNDFHLILDILFHLITVIFDWLADG